jgi:cob(I)alamin adenosyltransferase
MKRKGPRIIINTGDGKGKTTAALGLALRAFGHGKRVMIIQFVKADKKTGELAAAAKMPGVEIVQTGRGFVRGPQSPDLAKHRKGAEEGLRLAGQALSGSAYDVVILDEICTALALGLLDENDVAAALKAAPEQSVIVLTGRSATKGLIDLADTVTEMCCIKHGFNAGIPAEEGVEW